MNNLIIVSRVKGLYWNNNIGWIDDIALATKFSKKEKN